MLVVGYECWWWVRVRCGSYKEMEPRQKMEMMRKRTHGGVVTMKSEVAIVQRTEMMANWRSAESHHEK